ncbi:MAG: GNAT family N-acetyltransferase [Reyranella sp.]|nr:GNAT family N-acetyltransferase [Reyranella sp.]
MDETPVLRQAGPADAASVRALTRAAYAKWVPVIGREPKPMGADYEAAVRHHRVDLAEIGGELAALIETIAKPDHLLIENVAVAPAWQGLGLGRLLLRHAEELAVRLGHGEIRLYTNKRFEANVQLYLGVGYRIDREEQSALGVTVYMSKTLASGQEDKC